MLPGIRQRLDGAVLKLSIEQLGKNKGGREGGNMGIWERGCLCVGGCVPLPLVLHRSLAPPPCPGPAEHGQKAPLGLVLAQEALRGSDVGMEMFLHGANAKGPQL